MRRIVIAAVLVLPLVVAAWFGWRWYTTPVPPEIVLAHPDPALSALIEQARAEVLQQPRSGAAWGKLAVVLAANQFDAEAVECLVPAERFDPNEVRWPYLHGNRALLDGRPQEGIVEMRRALAVAKTPAQRATIRFRLALALIEDGQLDEAEQHLQAERAIEGDHEKVRLGLGLLAVARDNRAAARAQLEALTEVPAARKKACLLLANLSDDPFRAQEYRERAARLPTDEAWPDPFLAELTPLCVNRGARLRRVAELLRQHRLPEALALAQQLVAELPDGDAYFLLASILRQLNRHDDAEHALRTFSTAEPKNAGAHYFLAVALVERGDPGRCRQALEAADRALAVEADHAGAHVARAQALKCLGRGKEALTALRQALLCRPDFSDAHLLLGETLAEMGQRDEALTHLKNAVRFAAPDDDRPRKALEKWGQR
jgi:tetratricopeptide (TPR) repeat protein